MGADTESVNMVAMPLFHIGGGGWAVAGMYEGATSVIVRELDPTALIRLIPERASPTPSSSRPCCSSC